MSNNVIELVNEFKTEVEKRKFMEKQHSTIVLLTQQNSALKDEITHLKQLLINTPLTLEQDAKVERIIISPEEALIERQIELIQMRGIERELTLEDTKKLDLLIKNKRLAKEQSTSINGEVRKIDKKHLSNAELIQIATNKNDTVK